MENSQPNDSEEIKRAILAGHKIAAIKLYRERTGAGLREAKDAIEQMETQLRGCESNELPRPTPKPVPGMAAPTPEIADALFAGRKIEAIKLYREQTRVGLAEAKHAVDQMEMQLRVSAPGLFTQPPVTATRYVVALMILGALVLAAWKLFGHASH